MEDLLFLRTAGRARIALKASVPQHLQLYFNDPSNWKAPFSFLGAIRNQSSTDLIRMMSALYNLHNLRSLIICICTSQFSRQPQLYQVRAVAVGVQTINVRKIKKPFSAGSGQWKSSLIHIWRTISRSIEIIAKNKRFVCLYRCYIIDYRLCFSELQFLLCKIITV